jgi:tRNA(Arg) A34 adenosine deaminase TadA
MQGSGEERFMQMAIDLAIENVLSGAGGPFGAVVVKDGEVVAKGVNLVTGTNDPTAHAEVTAIRRACQSLNTFELQGSAIYSSCEPCPMCLTAILWARLDALYFGATAKDAADAGFDDSYFYEQVAKPAAERALPTTNFMREQGIVSFKTWIEYDGKVKY